jgi:hypothetical protein
MAWKKLIGIMASGALVGVVTFAGNGCSSSSSKATGGDGGGTDSGVKKDGSGSSSGGSGSSSGASGDDGGDGGPSYDGTTGKACMTDADCHTATGPGVNACSNDVLFTGSLGDAALYPTPVCIMPGECDPLANGSGQLAFCDGDPADPASPGVCVPNTNPPESGKGTCFPQCNFKTDGSAATGCVGKDVCQVEGFGTDSSGNPLGIGVCYGGCVTNADCSAAGSNATMAADKDQLCDTLYGICTTTVTAPPNPIGAGCDDSGTTSPCFCISNENNNLGFCSTFCIEGGTGQCPSGWICDLNLPTTLTNSMDASEPGFSQPNPGLGGFCAPACSIDSGVAMGTDSGACPSNSNCQSGDVGGPDCLPLQ